MDSELEFIASSRGIIKVSPAKKMTSAFIKPSEFSHPFSCMCWRAYSHAHLWVDARVWWGDTPTLSRLPLELMPSHLHVRGTRCGTLET